MARKSWEGLKNRRKFVRISQNELQQKLESILELLQIGNAGLANSRKSLIQEATNTKPQKQRRNYV